MRESGNMGGRLRCVATLHGILEPMDQTLDSGHSPRAVACPPVLVMHGNDDPFVPSESVARFREEMGFRKVDLTFVGFSGTTHAFTRPEKVPGDARQAFSPTASEESWRLLLKFLRNKLVDAAPS